MIDEYYVRTQIYWHENGRSFTLIEKQLGLEKLLKKVYNEEV